MTNSTAQQQTTSVAVNVIPATYAVTPYVIPSYNSSMNIELGVTQPRSLPGMVFFNELDADANPA